MKRILLFLSALFIATTAIAHTINWYVDRNVYHTTTCESGEDVTPPTAPEKYGYTFKGWDAYTPIEYIESTGTQYIDLDIFPKDSLKIQIGVRPIGEFLVLGARYLSEAQSFLITFSLINGGNGIILDYGSGSGYNRINTGSFTKNIIYNLEFGNRYIKDMITNQLLVYDTAVNFSQINYPLYLFSMNLNGQYLQTDRHGAIYYLKIYDVNTLVRDFIPVLDNYGTPCMYDKVERKFYYNAGTGDFIAGPIIGE